MVKFDIDYAEQHLRKGTEHFQNAQDAYEMRWAAYQWLSGAVIYLENIGLPTHPGKELMLALEGLERGHSSPIFRTKEGNTAGGREGTKAELRGEALACVEAFIRGGWSVSRAIGFTAASLNPVLKLSSDQLANLRKKVGQEAARKEPRRYKALIAARDKALAQFKEGVEFGGPSYSSPEPDADVQIEKAWEGAALYRLISIEDRMNIQH